VEIINFDEEAIMQKRAVILFSGGLDSTTCLAIARSQGFDCYALSFDYGQKHSAELEAAKRIADSLQVKDHKIVKLALNELGGSALTDPSIIVPDHQDDGKIPTTYVPARNTVFLSIALGWIEALNGFDIFTGANDLDYSGYPDCRFEYCRAFEHLANLATKAGVEGGRYTLHTPLLYMQKHEIIHAGIKLGIDYSMTVSCYRLNSQGHACGSCDSCIYRKKGFAQAGVVDPTRYAN
jgi:7-cyano-7-deazaguanine synthase